MKSKSSFTKLDAETRERDNNQCIICGKITGLEGHHIVPDIEKLNNIITLCHSCHKKAHKMAGCFRNGEDNRRKIYTKEEMLMLSKIPKSSHFDGSKYYNRRTKQMVYKNISLCESVASYGHASERLIAGSNPVRPHKEKEK
jgi:hypothetical protein